MASLVVQVAGDWGQSIHRRKMNGNAETICCIHRVYSSLD